MLFEDTNALAARYGLKQVSSDASSPSSALIGPSGSIQSVDLPLRLKASYIRFKSRIDQKHKQTSTTKKTRWAIRDKQKFMSLVEDIHQFIDGLEAITDSVEMATKRAALVREELSTVEDPEDLRLIVEACAVGNQQWSDAASVALDASACGAFNYHHIEDWMSAISDARASTIVDDATFEPSPELPEASAAELFFQSALSAHIYGQLFSEERNDVVDHGGSESFLTRVVSLIVVVSRVFQRLRRTLRDVETILRNLRLFVEVHHEQILASLPGRLLGAVNSEVIAIRTELDTLSVLSPASDLNGRFRTEMQLVLNWKKVGEVIRALDGHQITLNIAIQTFEQSVLSDRSHSTRQNYCNIGKAWVNYGRCQKLG
ncbi:MAG: hypothetical protein Q9226_008053 [Calogaya cf. arnoldii]